MPIALVEAATWIARFAFRQQTAGKNEIHPQGQEGNGAMEQSLDHRRNPELKQVVAEASRALAQLDAARLEELALSCQALNRELADSGAEDRAQFGVQAREAAEEMAVFARVLDVTRANLNVIHRLQDLRAGRLEYTERTPATNLAWGSPESGHGDN